MKLILVKYVFEIRSNVVNFFLGYSIKAKLKLALHFAKKLLNTNDLNSVEVFITLAKQIKLNCFN